jgi:glyoxylase-like metal-dependent hydrolase (beta-lactamase superfamily II)/ferredoxin
MATLNKRRSQNIPGEFYVDGTCIDCDTCRWMAPDTFSRVDEQSAVYQQPMDSTQREQAMQALLSCPTASIGTLHKPLDIKAVQETFPIRVKDSVYHCGYHSPDSFAASSYLIVRPQGNVLVDSPRFVAPLVKQIEELGGIRYLYLTHRDDVADHAKFQARFGCDRILHVDDITADTRDVEYPIQGHDSIPLAPDLLILPVPGHSKGHTVLLYQDEFLFTGDHLAGSTSGQGLTAFRRYCWYSWAHQIESMQTLLNVRFEWVLPGHGRRFYADAETMQAELQQCIDWMNRVAAPAIH